MAGSAAEVSPRVTTPEPVPPDTGQGADPLEIHHGSEASRLARLGTLLAGPSGVALAALVVGVAAAAFASQHDLMFLYADARSHLTIARRLIDGPNRGIVQLGTVWLPVPHLVLTPFVASRWLWHTGLAAIPVDIGCLMLEALSVFSIVRTLTARRWASWIGVAVLLTNPSLLYLHTTALTEPVLFAALLGTVAMLTKWAAREKAWSGGEIVLYCGFPAAVAVLSRYDGWAFVVAAAVFVAVAAQVRWRQWRYSLHITRCFVTLPVLAAVWWMWFNYTNYGDPLEFQRGKYSAQAQQELLARAGQLPDMGDLPHSIYTLTTSVWQGAGWFVLALSVVGMVLWGWRGRRSIADAAPWLLVVVPFGFYVLSLYTGQAALRLYNADGQGMFNLRYGVELVPGIAVFAALGASVLAGRPKTQIGREWRVFVGIAVIALVVFQATVWWPDWKSIPVVHEGLSQRAAGLGQYQAAEWLRDHAPTGRIAIDDSVNPDLPVIGADLDRVTAPFSGPRWNATLRDLRKAEWLYVDPTNPQDSIGKAVRADPNFARDFVLRHRAGTAEVYQRRHSP